MKLFHAKMKVNTCTVCERGLVTGEEEDGEIGVLAILGMPDQFLGLLYRGAGLAMVCILG